MIRRLTVLYDAHCGVCREASAWLERQPKLVPLELVPAGSEEATRRFPRLDARDTLARLTVVSDRGGLYHDVDALLVTLWALREWRERSITFAWAPLRPLVGLAWALLSALRRTTRCDGACGVPRHDDDARVAVGLLRGAAPALERAARARP